MVSIYEILAKARALGFKPTDDKERREIIYKGLQKTGGYCPCKVVKTEDTICPCTELRKEGRCTCKLFEPIGV